MGAGLPVNAMLAQARLRGDEVQRITGAFSGTLGYVMSGLQEGRPFSEIVTEAYEQGYTEPDPREDLNGLDVARKALILARGLGWRLDLKDVDCAGSLSRADGCAQRAGVSGGIARAGRGVPGEGWRRGGAGTAFCASLPPSPADSARPVL